MIGIYPGSFDPLTLGHMDIIKRASKKFEKLIVAVSLNRNKKHFFTIKERLEILETELKEYDNIIVKSFDTLLVDFAKLQKCNIIIRGIRDNTDFEYEMQMANINKSLSNDMETFFLVSDKKYAHISSSVVKEIISYNGNYGKFVTKSVYKKIKNKIEGE